MLFFYLQKYLNGANILSAIPKSLRKTRIVTNTNIAISIACSIILLSTLNVHGASLNPQDFNSTLAPLKQFKYGIAVEDVECGQGFLLIIKSTDFTPACVKPQTMEKLLQRTWGVKLEQYLQRTTVVIEPISCYDTICYIDWLQSYYESPNFKPKRIGNLTGADHEQTTEFIKDYYKKQGILILNVGYEILGSNHCQLSVECWIDYRLHLTVSYSDVDKMIKLGYSVPSSNIP